MVIAQLGLSFTRYQERLISGAYFEASTSFIFPETGSDSRTRNLNFRLLQLEIDEDSDSLDKLLKLLNVLLIEEVDEAGQGEISGYEDLYFFTHDGDFFRHYWRKYHRDSVTHSKIYRNTRFEQDGDMKKLLIYGEAIQEMLQGRRRMDHNLEEHPTVQGLKTRTLWEHHPGS